MQTEASNISLTNELFGMYAQAIVMGMGYDEFWLYEPRLFESYIGAFKQKTKNKGIVDNQNAWLSGFYVAKAIAANFAKSASYPEKPMEMGQEIEDEVVNEITEDKRLEKAYAQMLLFSSQFNANRKGA